VAIVAGAANVWQPRSWFGDLYDGRTDPSGAVRVAAAAPHRRRVRWRPYVEVASG
jgi:hypothetical protein